MNYFRNLYLRAVNQHDRIITSAHANRVLYDLWRLNGRFCWVEHYDETHAPVSRSYDRQETATWEFGYWLAEGGK